MDSNDNNNKSSPMLDMESSVVKFETQEELTERADYAKGKINSKFKDIEGKKRKNSENSDMDLEDSQNSSNESVKRRRYSVTQNDGSANSHNAKGSNKEDFEILIITIPGEWSYQQIINYVKNECKVNGSRITKLRKINSGTDFRIRLAFETREKLHKVLEKLQKIENEGKLIVYFDDSKDGSESDADSNSTLCLEECNPDQAGSNGPLEPDEDINSDTNNFYIRKEYLESLGIKPPITNWVYVTDFRCDKSELKDVLELAGNVLVCSVCTISTKYANVMYSHPLEAVQAVSMLNGQKYYGKVLKVKMITVTGDKPLLPKGLLDVGPGLGKRGKPLPDISEQYKRFVGGKSSCLDACLFEKSLLKRIGLTVDDELYKLVRAIGPPNSQGSNVETMDAGRNESPSDNQNPQNSMNKTNEFGPIGQNMMGKNIPVIRPPILNRPSSQMSQIRGPIPVALPSPMLPLRGQISSPLGPRVPMAPGIGGPRAGFPIMPNPTSGYPNCPPIPGFETGSDPNKVITGPRPQIAPRPFNVGHIANPRGPMPSPNRFPGPINTMLGPVGPIVGPHGPMPVPNGPMMSTLSFGPNVQMFKGPDPMMVRIINLPPLSTNFVNLCRKLTDYGQVVFLELTTPGCANVRFATPADADRCLQNYRKG